MLAASAGNSTEDASFNQKIQEQSAGSAPVSKQPAATNAATPATAVPAAAPVSAPQAPAATAAVAQAQAAAGSSVNLSPQAQQTVRVEAFTQLVAQLVQQVGAGGPLAATAWPANGVPAAVLALLSSLVQQATAGQALPQQLLSAQAWPQNLLQAVLQQAGRSAPSAPAGPPSGHSQGAAMAMAAQAAQQGQGKAVAIPALQNWLVLQGSIAAQDGTRGMSLMLKVPVAWAQAQAALAAALPGGGSPAGGGGAGGLGLGAPWVGQGLLNIAFAGSLQQLSSSAFGLVLQPQMVPGTPQALQAQLHMLRTSALLQLELQPLPSQVAQQAVQAAAAYTPAQLLPQEWQALLHGRVTDPWVQMAQLHASGQQPRQMRHEGEQRGLCVVDGCQYQGRAVCAQPFCAQMNYLWSVARAQSRA